MAPTLETARLRLRPVCHTDGDTLHGLLTNGFVRRYLLDDQVLPRAETDTMLAEAQRRLSTEGSGLWLIESKAAGPADGAIGLVGLWYFFDQPQPQLIYALLPEATGRGYATEATAHIAAYAFTTLGYRELIACCDLPNQASLAVMRRLGMEPIETDLEGEGGSPIVCARLAPPAAPENI
jgi:[ribosomal protein S5]-alanine N-acetyltransferase